MTVPKVASNVTFIPQSINENTISTLDDVFRRKRVCGYARVSTNMEEQESSYEAQVDYYTNYIKSNPKWEFAGLYSDEGISATSTKHREGFNRMIKDALDGKIDLIITKSISRFARNTVDALVNIRKLKEKNVEIYFEKENIYSLDSTGELMLSLLSSLAQEESRSISLNTQWGKRKAFADGKVYVGYKTFLGYDKGVDGKMVVNKEEAKTIKYIYKLFLMGYSLYTIKKELEKKKLKTPTGKTTWHISTIRYELSNEKYIGDAVLQKQYTVDYLTKKHKINNGELPKYYVKNDHEAIIDKATFDFVQVELKKRSKNNAVNHGNGYTTKYSGINIFSGKIVCGECGAYFGRKVWHSNDKYKRVVYQCNRKFENKKKCETGVITEDEVKNLFVKEYNALDKTKAVNNAKKIIKKITNTDELQDKIKTATDKANDVLNKINELIDKNSRVAMDQDVVKAEKDKLTSEYESVSKELKSLENEKKEKDSRRVVLESFINNLQDKQESIKEFDEGLFCALVDSVIVYSDRAEIKWRGI